MLARPKTISFCSTYIRWSNEHGRSSRSKNFQTLLISTCVAIQKAYLLFRGFEMWVPQLTELPKWKARWAFYSTKYQAPWSEIVNGGKASFRLVNSEALEQFSVVFLKQLMTNEMRKPPMSTKSKQGDGKPYEFHYYVCWSIENNKLPVKWFKMKTNNKLSESWNLVIDNNARFFNFS